MGRVISSVITGYVVMVVGVFALFSLAWVLLGAEASFVPGSWEVSGAWLAASVIVGVIAAVVGGYVCAAIARDPRGPRVLIVVVLVLGILFALPVLLGAGPEATGARPATVTMVEAMSNARQPVWIALLNPVLGMIGVYGGARLRSRNAA
ncbi:MAG TPA: hypothetical protein VGA22_06095 [Gemmatimonadales bacterium]|jgi:hypothetical protein